MTSPAVSGLADTDGLRARFETLASWLDDAAEMNDETVQSLRPGEARARHAGLRDAYRDSAHMVRAALAAADSSEGGGRA